jgi:hypothetical protein
MSPAPRKEQEIFDVGDRVRITNTFSTDGAPADPTTVSCPITSPSNVTSTPTVVRDAQGEYHVDLEPNEPGTWYYWFTGTGAVKAVDPGEFYVRPR